MRRVLAALALALPLGFLASGCGELKEDSEKPIVDKTPTDPPAAEEGKSPPWGKPRAKVPPSAVSPAADMKATDSLTNPPTPH
jgi:hypothetical protein